MNAGIAIALLAFVQLVLAWLADKSLGDFDLPIITQQLCNHQTLGMKEFIAPGGTVNKTKITEIVRITRLTNAARSVLVALFVAFVGALTTAVIAYAANPAPTLKFQRVSCAATGAAVAIVMLALLVIKLLNQTLSSDSQKETFPPGKTLKDRLRRYRKRLSDLNVLTPYLTAAFVINVVSIGAAIKLG